ncbi:MAG: AraC family transcriptional regulator [Oscillospiraceae bacterium]|nr:AraC family transcriptional regulator [Oscillospiraceae bacterium]
MKKKPSILFGGKHRQIGHRWTVSYLTVVFCSVATICVVLFSFGSGFATTESRNKLISSSLKISQYLDSKLEAAEKTAVSISLFERINFISSPYIFASEDLSVDLKTLSSQLNSYCNADRFIDNITVYFPQTDIVVNKTGSHSLEESFVASKRNDYSYSKAFYDEALIPFYENNEYMAYDTYVRLASARPLILYNGSGSGFFVVMELNTEELAQMIRDSFVDADYEELYLCNIATNEILLGDHNAADICLSTEYDSDGIAQVGGAPVIQIDSQTSPFRYFLTYENSYMTEMAELIYQFILSSSLFALIIGGLLSVVFVYFNYKPLGRIVSKIKEVDRTSAEKPTNDEYQYIESTLSTWSTEVAKAEEYSKKYEKAVWNKLLTSIMTSSFTLTGDTVRLLSENLLEFDSENYYCVILIGVAEQSRFDRLLTQTGVERLWGEIVNCSARAISGSNYQLWQHVEISAGKYAVIIKGKQEMSRDTLRNIYENLCAELTEKYSTVLFCSVGESRLGVNGIPVSFQIAEKFFVWQTFTENYLMDGFLKYNSTADRYYFYPSDWENKLIYEALKGNLEEVNMILDDVIRENCTIRQLSASMKKNLINRLLGTALSILEKMGQEDMDELTELEQRLDSLSELQCWAAIRRIFSSICEFGFDNQIKTENNKIYTDIISYVGEHFTDYNLSLKEISSRFSVPEYSVSKMFKSITGFNFLDYVNQKRIDRAKELLTDTEDTILSVAEQAGFENDRSFRRVFKKYTGCNPADYRAISRGEVAEEDIGG